MLAKETAMRCPEMTMAGTRKPDSIDVSPKDPHHTAAGTGESSCNYSHTCLHVHTSYMQCCNEPLCSLCTVPVMPCSPSVASGKMGTVTGMSDVWLYMHLL